MVFLKILDLPFTLKRKDFFALQYPNLTFLKFLNSRKYISDSKLLVVSVYRKNNRKNIQNSILHFNYLLNIFILQ